MRDLAEMARSRKITRCAAELVIDHSVQSTPSHPRLVPLQRRARVRAHTGALCVPALGAGAFDDFAVVPPTRESCIRSTSSTSPASSSPTRAPARLSDTLVGTGLAYDDDQRLGVLGWASADRGRGAMLGQPMSMLIPRSRCTAARRAAEGRPRPTCADGHADPARARRRGMFVEFYGVGVGALPIADGRRSATCRPSSARPARSSRSMPRRCAISSCPALGDQIALVEAYPRSRAVHDEHSDEPTFSDRIELDLVRSTSLAGPSARRTVSLSGAREHSAKRSRTTRRATACSPTPRRAIASPTGLDPPPTGRPDTSPRRRAAPRAAIPRRTLTRPHASCP